MTNQEQEAFKKIDRLKAIKENLSNCLEESHREPQLEEMHHRLQQEYKEAERLLNEASEPFVNNTLALFV